MPFKASNFLHATDPLKATAKGCLLWAESLENNKDEFAEV
jgi:hypothetical protein